MRFDILALAFLGIGSLTLAAAADPPAATQSERTASPPAAVVTDSASAATNAPAKVATPPPASSAVPNPTGAPKKVAAPELSAAEQRLINLGYKPQMRNGEKIYCRREAALGSRIIASQHCSSVVELATTTQAGKDYLDTTQRSQLNPVGH